MRVTQMVTDLIRESLLTTRGDMVRRGVNVAERFGIGAQFQALYTYDGDPTWIDPYYYLTDEGDMLVMGSEAPDKIPPGVVGTVLKGKGAETKPAFETLYSLLITKGDLIVRGTDAAQRLVAAAAGLVLKSKGAGALPAYEEIFSILTTRGDIIVRGAAVAARLGGGTTGHVLKTRGVADTPYWADIFSLLTTQGDIIVRGAAAAERKAAGVSGTVLKSAGPNQPLTWGSPKSIVEQGPGGDTMECRVEEIGDWNMIATTGVNVAHGLGADYKKIRHVCSVIRDDADTVYYNLNSSGIAGTPAGAVYSIGGTNIALRRTTGGTFDDAAFDDTDYNRGWVMFWYI